MNHASKVRDAIAASQIQRILLIDDAYDPPAIRDGGIDAFLDFLEDEAGREVCRAIGINEAVVRDALEAVQAEDVERASVVSVCSALYREYSRTYDGRFDPGDYFSSVKGAALAALKPLEELLEGCGEAVKISKGGLEDGNETYRSILPELVFVDYYLDADMAVDGAVGEQQKRSARRESLEFLKEVVQTDAAEELPAVVLMSSREITDVDKYRHDAGGEQILALRFGFLRKGWVRGNGETLELDRPAMDVLLDTSQGYLFGRSLQGALREWKRGAKEAFDQFWEEVAGLHLKDFAYLVRFRLHDEEQPLTEYMDWLLGECLRGLMEERVDWKHDAFVKLDDKNDLSKAIEGAFEGPSELVARFFHRVRVNGRDVGVSHRYQLGDIFGQRKGSGVRAVVTPDCDLVVRKGRARVKSVLTMGGTLNGFDKEDSIVDEFMMRRRKPYSVKWNPKDLQTYPVTGAGSLREEKNMEYLGTLRPLYAQAMQRRALMDLSRVGLPVAPALGINGIAKAWLRIRDENNPFTEIVLTEASIATIIPEREGRAKGHRVLLRRGFVNELLYRLDQVNIEDMREEDGVHLTAIRTPGGAETLSRSFLQIGVLTKENGKFGTAISLAAKPNTKRDAPWLQITVTVSDEALEELRTIDPLVP